jgi:hypothetical protein
MNVNPRFGELKGLARGSKPGLAALAHIRKFEIRTWTRINIYINMLQSARFITLKN